MPKFLEDKLRSEYGDNPHAIYGTMNKIGAMHGTRKRKRAARRKRNTRPIPTAPSMSGATRRNMDTVLEGLAHKLKMPRGMKDSRKHGIARTHIEHHHDGSHKITHHYVKPGVGPTEHGAEHMEALHDHLEEMLGGKPSEEELAE